MNSSRTVALAILLVVFAFTPTLGQTIQRPFDEAGTIQTIDAELEAQLELFPAYDGFREARLYQSSDTTFVLEISYQPDDQILREQETLTPAEVEQLRARVTERLEARAVQEPLNQEGRTELLVTSTLLSLGFYGYALPISLGIDSGTASTALYMLTSGAGFFGPYLWTRDRPVTEGQAKLFQYGGTRGIVHGILIGLLATGDDLSSRGLMGAGLATSITESFLGYQTAQSRRMTQGTAETIGVGGDFGLGLGLGAAFLIEEEDPNARLIAGPALLGSLAGIFGGHRLTQVSTYSTGDARVLRLMGNLGGLIGWTAADLSGTSATRLQVGATMASSMVGLGLSHRMLQDKNFSGSDGTYITLGTFGGMLTGQGVAYLISGDEEFEELDSTMFLTLGSLGATGGFILMYRTFVDEARTSPTGWRIQLNPSGLASRWAPEPSNVLSAAPLVRVRKTF
jgi:hypothetical protein